MIECAVYEVGSWRHLRSFRRGEREAYQRGAIAVSPDGRSAAIASARTLQIVGVSDGRELAVLESPGCKQRRGSRSATMDGGLQPRTSKRRVDLWDLAALRTELALLDLNWQD